MGWRKMARYRVGEIIRHWREQQGLTIEELAGTQLTSVTLWRIESGQSLPSKGNLEYLFQKLGLDPSCITTIYMDGKQADAQQLTDNLDNYLTTNDIASAEQIIHELEHNPHFTQNKFNKQYLLAAKASLSNMKCTDAAKVLDMLSEAFIMTRNNFDENSVENYFLTKVDFTVISLMALQHIKLKDRERGIKIFYQLKKNMDTHYFDKSERGKRYPHIIYNLTKHLGHAKRYEESIPLCDEGKKICIETGFLRLLPNIMTNKAFSLLALGDADACTKMLIEIHGFCGLCNRHEEQAQMISYAKERGINLSGLV